jgi:ankyrin repeat protein
MLLLRCCCCSGADKSAKNADDKTALEVATLNEQEDVAKLLE